MKTKTFQWTLPTGTEWLSQRGERFAELLCDISQELETDPCKEVETIIVGRLGRKLVELMPMFSWTPRDNYLLKVVDGRGLLGELSSRPVLYDHSIEANDKITVTNPRGSVVIQIENVK